MLQLLSNGIVIHGTEEHVASQESRERTSLLDEAICAELTPAIYSPAVPGCTGVSSSKNKLI